MLMSRAQEKLPLCSHPKLPSSQSIPFSLLMYSIVLFQNGLFFPLLPSPCQQSEKSRGREKLHREQPCFAGRAWGKSPSTGPRQRSPAWPQPWAPLHHHDLLTPMLPVDLFPDFYRVCSSWPCWGEQGRFFGTRLRTSAWKSSLACTFCCVNNK